MIMRIISSEYKTIIYFLQHKYGFSNKLMILLFTISLVSNMMHGKIKDS